MHILLDPLLNLTLCRQRFQKVQFLPSTLAHLAGVFKFPSSGERFQKVLFSVIENTVLPWTEGQPGKRYLGLYGRSLNVLIFFLYVLIEIFFFLICRQNQIWSCRLHWNTLCEGKREFGLCRRGVWLSIKSQVLRGDVETGEQQLSRVKWSGRN